MISGAVFFALKGLVTIFKGPLFVGFFQAWPFSFLAMTRMNHFTMIQETRFFFRFGLVPVIFKRGARMAGSGFADIRCTVSYLGKSGLNGPLLRMVKRPVFL